MKPILGVVISCMLLTACDNGVPSCRTDSDTCGDAWNLYYAHRVANKHCPGWDHIVYNDYGSVAVFMKKEDGNDYGKACFNGRDNDLIQEVLKMRMERTE